MSGFELFLNEDGLETSSTMNGEICLVSPRPTLAIVSCFPLVPYGLKRYWYC